MLVNMKEILEKAKEGKYAVGLFNAVNVEMARAIIETAEELKSPVIVGTAEVLLPAMSLERVAEYLIPMAKKASVPVCVHFDHGLTFEKCMEAIQLGYSSIMYDCSTDTYEDNVAKVAQMVKICHAMNVTVEGELGHVGDNEGSAGSTLKTATKVSKVTLSSVKSSKAKQIAVSWKTVKGASGYVVEYSTSKKFTSKTTRKVTVKKGSSKKTTLNSLKSKKKYYVRVRAYKTVNGKAVYGSYSSVKSVTVK